MSEPDDMPDPAGAGFDPDRLANLAARMARYVDDGRLPGWSMLLARHGRIAARTTYGLRDVDAGLPVERDTLFRIYSMTKPVTSVAAMALYERGEFALSDPIARWLPDFADMRVFAGGSDVRPVTVAATAPITVWNLLTHTSGLTYGFHRAHPVDAMYRAAGYEWSAAPDADLAAAVTTFARMPLLFQPGAEWNYSVSTDVLGRLVEVITGQPLDEALRSLVLDPLGMHDTTFTVGEADARRTAVLYIRDPINGRLRVNSALGRTIFGPSWLSGGGGLASTIGDYHRFAQFLLGRGRLGDVRILGDRTMRFMTTNQLPGGVDLARFGRPLYAEAPFDGVGFGLGFAVELDPVATRVVSSAGEFGWGGAASTTFWVDPAEDLTFVFMTQLLPSSTYPLRNELRQLIYTALVD